MAELWRRLSHLLLGGTAIVLCGCASLDVETASTERFAGKGYQTFSWKSEMPTAVSGSMDSLYRLATLVHDVVSEDLTAKGYRAVPEGGDFVVSYEFRAGIEDGSPLGDQSFTPTSSVVNRSPDPALIDNTYALSGPREVASLILTFEDGGNLATVWMASISQVVENRNQTDMEKVRRNLAKGVGRATRVLPPASG